MTRLSGVLWLSVLLLLVVPIVPAAEVLTDDAIVTMVKAGLGEELIISKIKISQGQYDLSTNDILRLKKDGVSEKIIQAMIEASARPESPSLKSDQGAAPPPAGESQAQEQEAIALYRQGRAVDAVAVFDRLLADRPNDDGLKIWKALGLLEQAREMRESKTSRFKPLVISAYAILKPLGQRQAANPDWNVAMAKAFWLNDRSTWARKAARKALDLRAGSAEAHLLLGDMAYEDGVSPVGTPGDPRGDSARWQSALASRREYEAALALTDLPSDLRAEALYKIGMISTELENKKGVAREYWEKAVAADPDSRYGRMAQEKLKTVPAK